MVFHGDVDRAAWLINHADALLIASGAGMGVDSGLPDFRGNHGLWEAYPPIAQLGLSFEEMATPDLFRERPHLAWGFYGHRFNVYHATQPHVGYHILRDWCRTRDHFIFTSNVDNGYVKSGFTPGRICEVHGSIFHWQCTRPCSDTIWDAYDEHEFTIDMNALEARGQLPRCSSCGALARPNILMFHDSTFLPHRSRMQEERLLAWLNKQSGKSIVIIETGAGTDIPTVRNFSEELIRTAGAQLIRINPGDPDIPGNNAISFAEGAADALRAIENAMLVL